MIIVEGIDHITLGSVDLKASVKFYSDLFDFEVLDDSKKGQAIITLDPIKLKLIKVDKVENSLTDAKLPLLSFEMDVDDFTEAISEIEEMDIAIVKGPESANDGEFLHFKDPSGNIIEIFYRG